jgi:hypothetical protein
MEIHLNRTRIKIIYDEPISHHFPVDKVMSVAKQLVFVAFTPDKLVLECTNMDGLPIMEPVNLLYEDEDCINVTQWLEGLEIGLIITPDQMEYAMVDTLPVCRVILENLESTHWSYKSVMYGTKKCMIESLVSRLDRKVTLIIKANPSMSLDEVMTSNLAPHVDTIDCINFNKACGWKHDPDYIVCHKFNPTVTCDAISLTVNGYFCFADHKFLPNLQYLKCKSIQRAGLSWLLCNRPLKKVILDFLVNDVVDPDKHPDLLLIVDKSVKCGHKFITLQELCMIYITKIKRGIAYSLPTSSLQDAKYMGYILGSLFFVSLPYSS